MVIVAGHLIVDAAQRETYLAGCVSAVEQGRAAAGNLDFALSPDIVDPRRINIFERWESQAAVAAFRGAGVDDEQGAEILGASVSEFDTDTERALS
ncbi:antibiotic biosynthesis monooxygenase [Nakamurella sp. A5-74]|uniref:Antibiotic biosynthesis monooxygenase n=1 Tax=Nakamurella sp. A5-74 TaxID=3158264 RepID=A0AAU8DTD0_9ACTN